MNIDQHSATPIFQQVADELSNAIIIGIYQEQTQIPSVADLSLFLKINPATALKGINILVDNGIVFKKRGLGMFVSENAKEKLLVERKKKFYTTYIVKVLQEAKRLGISDEEITKMIMTGDKYE